MDGFTLVFYAVPVSNAATVFICFRFIFLSSFLVGFAGGTTRNPTYEDVCNKETGHAEVVRVIYDPRLTHFNDLLKTFWESHDPTKGNHQGNDIGTQYRSAIFASTEDQLAAALASRDAYQRALGASRPITTEIRLLTEFFYAEPYHQQYLHKHPDGYCGLRGTGVTCSLDERP
ncbi:Peptide methionine sulfoxide reductase MsrA [Taenia crassiceps]|uniref:peptide-methionine (S)-S-oxide reductase n=1 Tax=Taenia crassiceps TaxID=6207 RepID=A0ABR4Q084_9CEST